MGRFVLLSSLELQARFARRIGNRANPPVIEKSAAVEHDPLDALFDRPLGDRLADRFGALDVAALDTLFERALQRRLDARGRNQGLALHVVDDLGVDMGDAAEDGQPRTRLGPRDALALAKLDAASTIVFGFDLHGYFAPVFPAFFFSTSPVSRMPSSA